MGFRMRKSFSLGSGLRLNASMSVKSNTIPAIKDKVKFVTSRA